MNKEMLAKCEGHLVRIRPVARRFHRQEELPQLDDDWRIKRVDLLQKIVELQNVRCDHCPILGLDHIYSYVSDPMRDVDGQRHAFLQLNVQVILTDRGPKIEPLPPPHHRWSSSSALGASSGTEAGSLDLFDRRYAVYEAIARFLASVIQAGCVEPGGDIQFLRDTKQAHFLFGGDPDVKGLLDSIYEHTTRLHAIQAKEAGLTGRALDVNVDKQTAIKKWFQDTFVSLESRFEKYLQFGP